MKKLCCIILLFLVSIGVSADEREVKLKTLMEAQGLIKTFGNQMDTEISQREKIGEQMMIQMLTQINPNQKFKTRFKNILDNFIKQVQSPWNAEEVVTVWGQYYGKNFSDQELEQLIEFYSSPIGKKEVAATKSALPEFTMHFQKISETEFKKIIQEFVAELRLVVKECNCKK